MVRASSFSDPFALRFPARAEELAPLRRSLARWLDAAGLKQRERDEIVLAVDEAAANAIEHAYAGRCGEVVVEVRSQGAATIVASVRDSGQWRTEPAPGERGRGFRLMRALSDAVEIERGNGTTVSLRRRVT